MEERIVKQICFKSEVFTSDLKQICFTNSFLHSLSGYIYRLPSRIAHL